MIGLTRGTLQVQFEGSIQRIYNSIDPDQEGIKIISRPGTNIVNIQYELVQQEVELLEAQLRDSPFLRIIGNFPENKFHEELESDYDNGNGNGHSSSNGNGNGHSSSNGNGNGYSSSNGNGNGNGHSSSNGNGNGHSSSNGNGNGHSESNGENGYEEHFDPQYLEPQGNMYPQYPKGQQENIHHPPQKGYPYQDGHLQMGQGINKPEFYGQQPDYIGHHNLTMQKPLHSNPGMGFGQYENAPMTNNPRQPDMYEKPVQQPFKGQPGQPYQMMPPQNQKPQTQLGPQQHNVHQMGINQPNYPVQFQQGAPSQHHQPVQNQPVHQKKMPPGYEGQSLNPPIVPHQQARNVPVAQPIPKEKPIEDYRQPGFRQAPGQGQEFQGQQAFQPQRPGFNQMQPQEPQQYHSKGAKANINTPPSQYYGKGKPEYYKGGYQKPEPVPGQHMGQQQQGYYDAYGNFDPYYQQGPYYESSGKSQDFGGSAKGNVPKPPQQQQFVEQPPAQPYEKAKVDRKPKQPAATEPIIKKPVKTATNPVQHPPSAKEVNPQKKNQPYEDAPEKTAKSMPISEDIGQTISWLQAAASPNEKFIDDTVENINRKPGFNRAKKKKFDRDRKLGEYRATVQQQEAEQGQGGRKGSDSSSQKRSDGGEQEAGDVAKPRQIDPKKRPNLDFAVEIDEGESESHQGSEPDDQFRIGEEDEYNEEQELISDDDGEEEFDEDEREKLVPESKRQAADFQQQARIMDAAGKQSSASGAKQPSKKTGGYRQQGGQPVATGRYQDNRYQGEDE